MVCFFHSSIHLTVLRSEQLLSCNLLWIFKEIAVTDYQLLYEERWPLLCFLLFMIECVSH